MARGFGFVNKAATEIAARGGGNSLWAGKARFKLDDGDVAIVRFVEDEDGEYIYGAWHHEIPVEGRAWGDQVPCIAQDEDGNKTDDDCPGCEADLPLKFKGYLLLLWRDAPVFKRNDKNQIVKDNMGDLVVIGEEDQIAIWSSGPRLFENLEEIDESYGGLGSRDFRVKRKGVKTKTTYTIVPAEPDGGKQAPSKADKKLMNDHEIDLAEFIKPMSYDEFEARLTGAPARSSNDDEDDAPSRAAQRSNPFKKRK